MATRRLEEIPLADFAAVPLARTVAESGFLLVLAPGSIGLLG